MASDTLAFSQLDNRFPKDPYMLLSVINTKLRDDYPDGLDNMCRDMNIDKGIIITILHDAGFDYMPEANQFR